MKITGNWKTLSCCRISSLLCVRSGVARVKALSACHLHPLYTETNSTLPQNHCLTEHCKTTRCCGTALSLEYLQLCTLKSSSAGKFIAELMWVVGNIDTGRLLDGTVFYWGGKKQQLLARTGSRVVLAEEERPAVASYLYSTSSTR